jgi:hypothetical protein
VEIIIVITIIIIMIFTAVVVFVCFLSVLRAMPDGNILTGMSKHFQTLLATEVTLDPSD